MEALLQPLLPLFERERAAGRALVLGVLVRTDGSTYRKPGALMVIAGSGEYAGLLSGGCLEGDLRGHAQRVLADGSAGLVRYDLRSPDDLLWGLGIGCEGEMQILLLRCGPDTGWQPLASLAAALSAHAPAAVGIVVESADPAVPRGSLAWPAAAGPRGGATCRARRAVAAGGAGAGAPRPARGLARRWRAAGIRHSRSPCRRACSSSGRDPMRCRWPSSPCGCTGR